MSNVLQVSNKRGGGEAYFEIEGLYFGDVYQKGLRGFFTGDAGYLPVFPKVISLFLIAILGVSKYAPFFMQIISLAVIAGVFAFFITENFSGYFSSKVRFLIVLIMSCTQLLVTESQMILFLNFSYFGILLAAYIYMLNLEKKSVTGWCLVSGLMIASKGTYLVLLPIIAAVIPLCIRCKKYRTLKYTLWLEFCLLVQLIYVFFSSSNEKVIADTNIKFFIKQTLSAIWYYIATVVKIIFLMNEHINPFAVFFFGILILLFVHGYILVLISRKNANGILLICLETAAFLQILINQLGNERSAKFVNESGIGLRELSSTPLYTYEKNVFFVYVFLMMAALFLIHEFMTQKHQRRLGMIILIGLAAKGMLLRPQDMYVEDSIGNWMGYSVMLTQSDYAIPNYNTKRFLINNCRIAYLGEKQHLPTGPFRGLSGIRAEDIVYFDDPNRRKYCLDESIAQNRLLAVYTQKLFLSQTDDIYCVFRDSNNHIVWKQPAVTSDMRTLAVGFIPDAPVENCSSFEFRNKNGEIIDLQSFCFLAVQ